MSSSSFSTAASSHRHWLLAAVCLAALGMPLSFTGPAVALPLLREALGGSPVQLNWVTNAFMLSFGGALLAAGVLADTYGRKRLFLGGLALIVVASALAACARGIVGFDLARAAQGLGAAAAFAAGTAALAQCFEGAARTRAFSLIGTAFGAGLACGPMLAGGLGNALGWRGVLLGPAVLSLMAAGIALWHLRESHNPQAMGLDLPGTLSFTGALSLLTLGVLQAPDKGWGNAGVLAALAGAAALGAAFVAIERRVAHPMFDLSLLRYPRFVGVQLLASAPAYAFVVLLVLLPIRFIGLEGRDTLDAARAMLALTAPILLVPTLAAWLAQRFSAGVISALGLLVCALGLYALSCNGPGASEGAIAGSLLLIGGGIGLPWGLMDGLAVSVVPRERAGVASGIFNTVRVAGEGIALALVSAGLAALVARELAHRMAHPSRLSEAAQDMVTGNLHHALLLLPGMDRATLLEAYGVAFSTLLHGLMGVTVLTALVVFGFLREEKPQRHEVPAVP